ncbi:hypothetical protein BDN71DRAFT_1494937 [Pleurotus eryngii]|uniref:Glycosyltransferase 61 catalytic domain-containing protein n=1 Tax=Pleurotus eryngii TaxID=5323 RepID=A0A9P6A0T6_PLEER|nr:hypothetical protein BDN71DRAFT_1494937 [Pleurotus eryngii]
MRQATRYLLLVLAAVCILAALALLHSGGTSVRLANASLERLCGTAGFSAGVYLDQKKPAANSDDESISEGELAIGLHVKELARTWNQHETKFIRGRPGFMMFQNLYLHNGTFYAITSHPESIPESSRVLCGPPVPKEKWVDHPPATAQRWQVLTPAEAEQVLGKRLAGVLAGTTFLFNDGPGKEGFLGHYFHFVAEAFAGAWRVYTSSPLSLLRNTAADIVFPSRVMLPRGDDWRDIRANLNTWFLNTILPNTAVEDIYQWEDRAKSNSVHVFSEIIIVDRWTAHRVPESEAQVWNKMTADIMASPAPFDWWSPLRHSLMQRIGIEGNARNRPVITYIDRCVALPLVDIGTSPSIRQATGRKLVKEDHDTFVKALAQFGEDHDVEINSVQMEYLSKAEQFDIGTRTDIMVGVHGNGLSHQMWMKAGGSVLELYDTGGFMRDYQLLAEAMHHTHYVIWNDTIHDKWRENKKTFMTKNFNNVHLHTPFVIELLDSLVRQIRDKQRS